MTPSFISCLTCTVTFIVSVHACASQIALNPLNPNLLPPTLSAVPHSCCPVFPFFHRLSFFDFVLNKLPSVWKLVKTEEMKALKEKKDNQGFFVFFCWPLRIREAQDDDVLTNTHEKVDLVYFFFLAAPCFMVAGDPFFEDTTFRFFVWDKQTDSVCQNQLFWLGMCMCVCACVCVFVLPFALLLSVCLSVCLSVWFLCLLLSLSCVLCTLNMHVSAYVCACACACACACTMCECDCTRVHVCV